MLATACLRAGIVPLGLAVSAWGFGLGALEFGLGLEDGDELEVEVGAGIWLGVGLGWFALVQLASGKCVTVCDCVWLCDGVRLCAAGGRVEMWKCERVNECG